MKQDKVHGTDRIELVLAVPRDDALPLDVQGVGLRRRVIDLMQEIATIDENTVRYKGANDNCEFTFDDRLISMWQMNLLAVRFIADGKAESGIVGSVVHKDHVARTYSFANVVRNEYA